MSWRIQSSTRYECQNVAAMMTAGKDLSKGTVLLGFSRRRREFTHVLVLSLVLQCLTVGVLGFSLATGDNNNNNDGVAQNQVAPFLPTSPDAMIRQASTAIRTAMDDYRIHRQTIRLPLSESMYSSKEESFVADRAIGWQGGPQETFRFVSPLSQQLMREIGSTSKNDKQSSSGLTPKIQEQILLDFDGSSLLNAESPFGPLDDSIALIQPNTDKYYVDLIQRLENEFSDTPGKKAKRMFLLINPAWRDADSWGFFSKQYAQKQILDRYETTYAIDQFIVKGNKLSLLKVWPYDWCVYYTPLPQPGSEAPSDNPQLLGTFSNRPEYSEIERLVIKG